MKRSIFAAALAASLAIAPGAFAQSALTQVPAETVSGVYALDKTHASITWKVNHLGLSKYTARFTRFDASLDWNADDPTKSTLAVTVDPTSLETDYPNPEKEDFDAKLSKDPEWLNAGKFPEITFKASKLEKTSDTTGKMTGELEMLGVAKPVTFDVTFNGAYKEHPMRKQPTLGFSATTTIKRSEWGFTKYIPNIGDEVLVLVEAEFMKP